MKPTHKKLLNHLRENSRDKLAKISRKTNIPISTLFDTLQEIRGDLFTRATVLLDFTKLGYHTRAHINVKVQRDKKEELQKHLECHNSVNNLYKINDGWDFMFETIHSNIKELDNYLDLLQKNFPIEKITIHYLIDDIKREAFTPQ